MPQGYLWDVVDYVPLIIDAGLTGRGGWVWGSSVLGGDPIAGILMPFSSGDKILTVGADKQWYEVSDTPPYTAVARGAALNALQNPVQFLDTVILPDGDKAAVPQVLTAPGGALAIGNLDPSAPHAPFATVYKGLLAMGGAPGATTSLRFLPSTVAVTSAWDPAAVIVSTAPITALGSLRSVLLLFHAGSVTRVRGSTAPHTGATDADMFEEGLFDRIGCTDPKTIAYWNDNCIFADEHGVHITDGAVVRNLASQGSILYFWRQAWANKISAAGCTFLDYYMITLRYAGAPSVTLIADLNRRQWFRFSNVYSQSYFSSSGGTGMERVWAGMAGTNRLARIAPTFFPTLTLAPISDADGAIVLPEFETPWYRLGNEGRKRTRFVYLSYDARSSGAGNVLSVGLVQGPADNTYTALGGVPLTTDYSRYKLPINGAPYGVGFRVQQLQATSVTRVYDLAVEGQPLERSRL
jgi:hypothetical protein